MTRKQILQNLKGVFPPLVTPFNRSGKIDESKFQENLRRYTNIGLSGFLIAGSTGEGPLLTARERLRLIDLARRIVRPPEIILVGTGLESTPATLELSREAVERGADALLILTPAYYKSKMDTPALVHHFRALGDKLKRPVMIYNIPQFTGVKMLPEAFKQVARHPNVVGVKESSGDFAYIRSILRAVPRTFRVLTGSAMNLLPALEAGAAGAVLGQADFMPELCIAAYDAFKLGRHREAKILQDRLLPLIKGINIPFGVAGVKAAMDLCGYAGGDPRSPLLPLSKAARRQIAAILREARMGLAI